MTQSLQRLEQNIFYTIITCLYSIISKQDKSAGPTDPLNVVACNKTLFQMHLFIKMCVFLFKLQKVAVMFERCFSTNKMFSFTFVKRGQQEDEKRSILC